VTLKKLVFKLLILSSKAFSDTCLKKVPFFTSIYKFIYELSKPKGIVLIKCQDNKMYLNMEDNGVSPGLLNKGVYEPFQTAIFQKLLVKNMTVVNIGANIGYYTLIAAHAVGPNGRVYAFEPEPTNYKILVKNIEVNAYKNVIPIQAAVSDKQGTLKLFLDKFNFGGPSLAEQNVSIKNGYIEVETDSLDNFIEKYDKALQVDLIQMDAQGSEGLILHGALNILLNNNLRIIMEFWPYGLSNMKTDALGLLRRIESYGFKIGLIDETNKCVSYLVLEQIVNICINLQKNGRGHVSLLLGK